VAEGVCEEFPAGAIFPAADLVDVDVVEGSSGVAVMNFNLFCRLFSVFVNRVFGYSGIGVDFRSTLLGS
jgi:hypothetical protein